MAAQYARSSWEKFHERQPVSAGIPRPEFRRGNWYGNLRPSYRTIFRLHFRISSMLPLFGLLCLPLWQSRMSIFWFWKIPVSRACFESNVNLPDSLRKISFHFRDFFVLVVLFYDFWWRATRRTLSGWYSRFSGIYCIKPQIIRIFLSVRIEFIVFKYLLRHIVVSIVWIFLFFFQGGWYMRIYLLLVEYGTHRKY